ncbi:MAG: L,D-transpeptidase, partial [Rhizobiales bacterium]|nr:L,D-transpeptidase [Hyphomicrobiales bacterium]
MSHTIIRTGFTALALSVTAFAVGAAQAQPLSLASTQPRSIFDNVMPAAPYEAAEEETGTVEVPAHLRRQVVQYRTAEAPGTIII